MAHLTNTVSGKSWLFSSHFSNGDYWLRDNLNTGLVGSTFDFGSGDPRSIASLCVALAFLTPCIQSTMLKEAHFTVWGRPWTFPSPESKPLA